MCKHLLVKLLPNAYAQTMVVTTLYKDYQEKEGIMFPMTISQSFGPQSIDFKVSNIVVNPEFADSDFE